MTTRLIQLVCQLTLVLGVIAVAPPRARADDAALHTAKAHFERGQKLYALARFREALDEYQLAFDASPRPELLFDIAQCYRNLGDYPAAVFSYRKYLQLAPDAANREQVEQLIGELETRQDQRDTQRFGLAPAAEPAIPAPAPAAPAPAPTPLYRRWWLWTAAGAVAVAAGGVAIYAATRGHGAPSTDLGNIMFGK